MAPASPCPVSAGARRRPGRSSSALTAACGGSTWTPPALRRLHGSYRSGTKGKISPTECPRFQGNPASEPRPPLRAFTQARLLPPGRATGGVRWRDCSNPVKMSCVEGVAVGAVGLMALVAEV